MNELDLAIDLTFKGLGLGTILGLEIVLRIIFHFFKALMSRWL